MSGTDLGYADTRTAIGLRMTSGSFGCLTRRVLSVYGMSGTGQAHGAIGLRACYGMSGTELAYGAPRSWL
eukprot:1825007-Rhodomonas_salina.2